MQFIKQRVMPYAVASIVVLTALAGCATSSATSSGTSSAGQSQTAQAAHYFMVFHENGRVYAFGDKQNYLLFMEHDEVPLTRTRIGGGPEGQTVVFGITKDESKKLDEPSVAEKFFDDKADNVSAFYGEVFRNGRYHVFGEWQDFKDYLSHKEITFTFTEIGTGPKGETVIYALNSKTKKQGRPVKLIEQFKKLRQK